MDCVQYETDTRWTFSQWPFIIRWKRVEATRKDLSSIPDATTRDLPFFRRVASGKKIRARSASPLDTRIDTFARCCASKRRWIMGIITPRHRRRCEGISVTSSALDRHISSPREGRDQLVGSVAAVHHFGYNKQTQIWCPSSAYLGLRLAGDARRLRMPVLVRLNLR